MIAQLLRISPEQAAQALDAGVLLGLVIASTAATIIRFFEKRRLLGGSANRRPQADRGEDH